MDKIRTRGANDEFLAEIAKGGRQRLRWREYAATLALHLHDPIFGEPMKAAIPPQLRDRHGALFLWQHVHHPLDQAELRVELCNECHPFFTGKQRSWSTRVGTGVERFQRRYGERNAKSKAAKS